MPLDHYVPACFIGRFSSQTKGKSRKRQLFCYDFHDHRFFQTNAEGLFAIKDYYEPHVDKMWGFESSLPAGLSRLIDGTIDGKTWARVLVPFVASLFVRSPNFSDRFEERIKSLQLDSIESGNIQIDNSRIFELQRILASVMTANWFVCRVLGDKCVIMNDIGYIPYENNLTSQVGFAIPLNPKNILIIEPCMSRLLMTNRNNQWWPNITFSTMSENFIDSFNETIASYAQRYIIGASKSQLESSVNCQRDIDRTLLEPYSMGFMSGVTALVNEFAWHRLVTCIEDPPNKWGDGFLDFRYDNMTKGWFPGVVLPMNLPEFIPLLIRRGDGIACFFQKVNYDQFIEDAVKFNDDLFKKSNDGKG